ncbi:hypothetical protein AWH62_09350 [Maricaulis sp. W15]|nr:hypothetical protein AWH62_09350 [Maricaulis sp. W15]
MEPRYEALELGFQEFDQSEAGWRGVAREGCYLEAANLISNYKQANLDDLGLESTSRLEWHEGQMRAYAGDYSAAINLFRATFDTRESGTADRHYAEATIAFLQHDRAALQAARDELADLPPPEGFEAAIERFERLYPDHPVPTWPLNLNVVDKLVRCFGATYEAAYSGQCASVNAISD